jgi:ABC-type enterochelin transport system permease subunit
MTCSHTGLTFQETEERVYFMLKLAVFFFFGHLKEALKKQTGKFSIKWCAVKVQIGERFHFYEEESKSNLNIFFLLTEYVQIGLKILRHFST